MAYVVRRDGAVWLRRRPDNGLLGGMQEVPSTVWREAGWSQREARKLAPFGGRWHRCGEVRHVFTHFGLELEVWRAPAPAGWSPAEGRFVADDDLPAAALPSLMKKILAAAAAG